MRLAGILRLGVAAAAAALTACSGPAPSHPAQLRAPEPTYYLALGDSLAQGVQPNAAGVSVKTGDGYPDQLYATLHRTRPGLELVKLGCPGETTTTLIDGGLCHYRGGSQLAAAADFLRATAAGCSWSPSTSAPTTRSSAAAGPASASSPRAR